MRARVRKGNVRGVPYNAAVRTTAPWQPQVNFNPRAASGRPVSQPLDPSRPDPHSIVAMLNSFAETFGRTPEVRQAARQILGAFLEHNALLKHFKTLGEWVRSRGVYVADPTNGELITSPLILLNEVAATGTFREDCDGHCVLLSALCHSVGTPAMVAGVRLNGAFLYNHVICALFWNGALQLFDPCAKNGTTTPQYDDLIIPPGYQ